MTKAILISVYVDKRLYSSCINDNPHIKETPDCAVAGIDNTIDNQGIAKRYNQFLEGYDYTCPTWFVFCHSDWELREDIIPLLKKLDQNCLYGPVGAILYKKDDGFFVREYRGQCFEKKRDGTCERHQVCSMNHTGAPVDTFDCQCLLVHSDLVCKHKLRFDEKLTFDLYVEDFCISAKRSHGIESKILNVQSCHWNQADTMEGREQYFAGLEYLNTKYPDAMYAGVVTLIGGKSTSVNNLINIVPEKIYCETNESARGTIYQVDVDPNAENDSRSILMRYVSQGATVLDVGCACGDLGRALHKYKDCVCYGLEYNPDSIEVATSTKAYELVRQADLNNIGENEYPEYVGKFDYIIYGDVLEHVYDPEKVLNKMLRYLKPDGRVLVSLPNLAHASIKAHLLLDDFTYTDVGLLDTTHIRFFTHKSIPSFMANNRLIIEDFQYTISDILGFQSGNPYPNLPISVKQMIFHDPHSFVCQYVMRLRHEPKKSFEACVAENEVLHTLDEVKNSFLALYRGNAFTMHAPYDGAGRVKEIFHLRRLMMSLRNGSVKIVTGTLLLPASMVYAGSLGNWVRRMGSSRSFLTEVERHSFLVMEKMQKRRGLYKALVQRSLDIARTLRQTNSVRATIGKCVSAIRRKSKLQNKEPEAPSRYASYINRFEPHTSEHLIAIGQKIALMATKPLLSLHVHVDEDRVSLLDNSIHSILVQAYENWELCITVAPSLYGPFKTYVDNLKDSRIRLLHRKTNEADLPVQSALNVSDGDFFVTFGCGDKLAPFALYMVANEILKYPDVQVLYSDADVIIDGVRQNPFFKPEWNEALLLEQDYICQLCVYKTLVLKKVGGFVSDMAPCHLYDASLRMILASDDEQIHHIPWVLYHYCHDNFCLFLNDQKEKSQRAVQKYLKKKNIYADVFSTYCGTNHVVYAVDKPHPMVSCIIGMKDKASMTRDCIMGVLNETDYDNLEILLINNGSVEADSFELFKNLESEQRVRIIHWEHPFNYSEIQNVGVREAKGEYVALLNNDIVFKDPNWLKEMLGHAQRKNIGAVGAKLLFADGRLQHGGIILGPNGAVGHTFRDMPENVGLQKNIAHCARWISAVTGACLVVSKEKYLSVDGMNEDNLKVGFNDVDFCLRLLNAGYHNLYTPHVQIYHLESVSRGLDNDKLKKERAEAELKYLITQYSEVIKNDPQYNPNLSFIGTNYDIISENEKTRHMELIG